MTPILRNRHEKVQEASINLIGRIADRGAEFVSAREWMRICFELLDLLKAHKKAIRRAAVNSFGYIAKAIGPQDVLSVLLTNLKVQDRQSRVCSTVAIGACLCRLPRDWILMHVCMPAAIVAETCGPFTCIPAILNEYRTPELNVRNGCLKAMSFLFEYIGEMGKDYIHSVLTCLEDALTDRDQVHRQTAASIVKHLALGTAGLGVEDAHLHLLNLIFPNIFESESFPPAVPPGYNVADSSSRQLRRTSSVPSSTRSRPCESPSVRASSLRTSCRVSSTPLAKSARCTGMWCVPESQYLSRARVTAQS